MLLMSRGNTVLSIKSYMVKPITATKFSASLDWEDINNRATGPSLQSAVWKHGEELNYTFIQTSKLKETQGQSNNIGYSKIKSHFNWSQDWFFHWIARTTLQFGAFLDQIAQYMFSLALQPAPKHVTGKIHTVGSVSISIKTYHTDPLHICCHLRTLRLLDVVSVISSFPVSVSQVIP